ncbi:MAG: endolytic transglycosylase MltG [Saprospiraceae bacterium]|jgi:UPF0755 protein|nr:endolytic transglycosylase MltG [Saprospiraceae bacterium]
MNKTTKITLAVLAILAVVAGAVLYSKFLAAPPTTHKEATIFVKIPTDATFDTVVLILQKEGLVRDEGSFRWLATKLNYARTPMRSGRYEVNPKWGAAALIRHLKVGPQAPVKVVLNNERLLEEVAAKVARFIEPDSATLITLFQDDNYLQTLGYSRETLMSLFIPNTYEFYWNVSAKSFLERMAKEHDAFWDKKDRLAKAKAMGLTPQQVYTFASIVEKETTRNEEKSRIAGVYLNRIKSDWPMQADPTLVFATRDFEARRVTNYHKEFDSPYNTYRNKGLPPGPISMASIASIDAVLNAENHEYFYFCAKPDGSGLHAFAATLEQHNENAVRYREELEKMGL